MMTLDLFAELAKTYGTPLYVYDADTVRQRLLELKTALSWRPLKILYAMKANYNPALLQVVREEGAGIDAVSPGDVIMALKTGFAAPDILYTANNITERELHEVHERGVLFNIGALSQLEKYGRAFPGSKVCLRFNPDVIAGENRKVQTGGALTKFGILLEDVRVCAGIAAKYHLQVIGLHEHTGSGISDFELYLQAVRNLLQIAQPELFPDLQFIDFGGGFSVPYRPKKPRIDYTALGVRLSETLEKFCNDYGHRLAVFIEPGKFVAAESGFLLTRVNTIKDNKGRLIAGTDSGFPQLIRPILYDAYHHIVNVTNPAADAQTYDICGNICESGDCFAVDRPLAEVREGDLLAVQNAGAYCYAMGGVYNLRPMPAEVLVDGGKARLVRRRLTNEELVDSILKECCNDDR